MPENGSVVLLYCIHVDHMGFFLKKKKKTRRHNYYGSTYNLRRVRATTNNMIILYTYIILYRLRFTAMTWRRKNASANR